MSQTIVDYYKYAALATASYVRMGGQPLDGATFARIAANPELSAGGRLPLVLGTALFNPADANAPRWNILNYYGGDVPGVQDNTGFAATLFERGGEKVLAIRGTEPGSDRGVDLFQADLGAIGILGMALPQAVSMINLMQRLKAGAGTPVLQLRVQTSLTQPAGPHVRAEGAIPGSSVYISFSLSTATGLGLIGANEKVTVTGHSLGGHLAALAARPRLAKIHHATREGGNMLARFVHAFLTIFIAFKALSSVAAEIAACDLVDKATASQIMGRPIASGPRASKYVLAERVRTDCDFGAEGAPVTVVTVTLSEFKSLSAAKAWADQANTPRDPSGSIETERSIGDTAVWWSGGNSAGYVVRKGGRVLEVYIRSAASGAQPFKITFSMRQQLRRAALRATEKL